MSRPNKYTLTQQIDEHAASALLPRDAHLDHALTNSVAKGLPPIAVSPLAGQYLAIQAQLINAKSVLEVGTLGGYSTIWFAGTGAHVTSLEIDPKHREVALENVKAAGLGDRVEVILGAALDTLPKLKDAGRQFDLVFIDADWGEQWEYFQWAVELTRPNGCIYVDNVVRTIIEDGGVVNQQSLITKVGGEERVQATLVSTVSSHKNTSEQMYDGFILARRRE